MIGLNVHGIMSKTEEQCFQFQATFTMLLNIREVRQLLIEDCKIFSHINFKKMRKGFELIRTRELSNRIKTTEIEDKLGFSLPPLYKFFIELFEIGSKSPFKCDMYYDNNLKEQYYATGVIYEPLKDNEKWFLSVSYFDDVDKVVNDWKSYLCHEREWSEFKFLRIAGIGQGGGLFVSTRSEDLDVIYQVVWDWEEPYFKVADNIFEFMKGFVEYMPETLQTGIKKSQLYKNYGEDFWRVREEYI